MKVLYISYDGLLDSIPQSQILPYLRLLSKDGNEFTLVSFEKRDKIKSKSIMSNLQKNLEKDGIQWLWRPYHKRPQVLATSYDILQGSILCLWLVFRKKIKIIHARSYVSAVIALFIKYLFRIKFIFDMRGFWPDEKVNGGVWRKNSFIYYFTKYLERIFLSRADTIVVLTNKMKNELEATMKLPESLNIDVIPTCVDLHRFVCPGKSKSSSQSKTLVYLGSLGTVYMIKEILEFFRLAKKQLGGLRLLVLTHSDEQIIAREINKLNICPADIKVVRATHEEVPSWLQLADIGIAFYKPAFSAMGRSPTKMGEYLACGLIPVINLGVGDCNELLEKERVGVIVKGFSSQDYAESGNQLHRLLAQKDIKFRCRGVAEKYFSLKNGVEHYNRIYKRLYKEAE